MNLVAFVAALSVLALGLACARLARRKKKMGTEEFRQARRLLSQLTNGHNDPTRHRSNGRLDSGEVQLELVYDRGVRNAGKTRSHSKHGRRLASDAVATCAARRLAIDSSFEKASEYYEEEAEKHLATKDALEACVYYRTALLLQKKATRAAREGQLSG